MQSYEEFLGAKREEVAKFGFEPTGEIAPFLFPHQRDIVAWALRRGRGAVFADTGLGKTLVELEWSRHVAAHTGGRVLILAPLAVAKQTVREANAFGMTAEYAKTQAESSGPVVVTNYERLANFNPSDFVGIVLDESSILKAFMGSTKRELVAAFRATPFKLACTATPAPNDHMELGNHSEFLGVLSGHEMLQRWFINDTSTFGTYRLKGHAVEAFWDWVASWAVMVGKPSDMGHSDDGFVLPELTLLHHGVEADITQHRGGKLFRIPELSATSYHREKRLTVEARAAQVAELVSAEPEESWLVWCDTDYEADALMAVVQNATEVRGSDKPETKESRLIGFTDGSIRVLVTKPSLAGLGLNFQHCARMAFIGPTYSYEAYYQAIRRCWRFGQKRPVNVHLVMAQTEREVWNVLVRKADDHERMKREMFKAARRNNGVEAKRKVPYEPRKAARLPQWLKSSEAA